MTYSCLPWWPFILFGIIEPVLLTWAYFIVLADPFKYFNDQVPTYALKASDFTPQAEAMTLQLGNVLLLLAAMAVICSFTNHSEIAKWYLIAVTLADYGHIYAAYRGMGKDFWDVSTYNDLAWGNIGTSAFLNVNRILTVLGAFGTVGGAAKNKTS